MEDPTTKYPKPPYKKQSQPWPGLAGKMDPPPDHGEKSYRGSNRLSGRKALVTGGDSGMGRAAAIAFAREGADVAINYLPEEEPDAREVIALIKAEDIDQDTGQHRGGVNSKAWSDSISCTLRSPASRLLAAFRRCTRPQVGI